MYSRTHKRVRHNLSLAIGFNCVYLFRVVWTLLRLSCPHLTHLFGAHKFMHNSCAVLHVFYVCAKVQAWLFSLFRDYSFEINAWIRQCLLWMRSSSLYNFPYGSCRKIASYFCVIILYSPITFLRLIQTCRMYNVHGMHNTHLHMCQHGMSGLIRMKTRTRSKHQRIAISSLIIRWPRATIQ